jgi:hypothetical protein
MLQGFTCARKCITGCQRQYISKWLLAVATLAWHCYSYSQLHAGYVKTAVLLAASQVQSAPLEAGAQQAGRVKVQMDEQPYRADLPVAVLPACSRT